MELGHGSWIEFRHPKIMGLGLQELFELPLAIGPLQARDMGRSRRNDTHVPQAAVPRLVAHGIEKRGERILLNLLGSWPTKRFDSIDCNHAYMVTRILKMSNEKYKYPPTFLYHAFELWRH
jgi:hypothetical protein